MEADGVDIPNDFLVDSFEENLLKNTLLFRSVFLKVLKRVWKGSKFLSIQGRLILSTKDGCTWLMASDVILAFTQIIGER